jgi:hypothetical protein
VLGYYLITADRSSSGGDGGDSVDDPAS